MSDINQVAGAAIKAKNAFEEHPETSSAKRVLFLTEIIAQLENNKTAIVAAAQSEANLPATRMENEFNRTISQIKLFISVISEEHWKEISIDIKKNDSNAVTVDLRKTNVPIGPVAVFGASNFPLAFSVAGGDTISAFAAGCPVIVKAHNAHLKTSELVAQAIQSACAKTNMPEGFFAIIYDEGFTAGIDLVKHPFIKAVGFTGSYLGGKALMNAVATRPEPIPVYAEMGSLNPVIVLPDELKNETEKWAKIFAASITAGCGQFCTKPGLFFALESEPLDRFITALHNEMKTIAVHPMLHAGIKNNFETRIEKQIKNKNGLQYLLASPATESPVSVSASIAVVDAADFISSSELQEEYFGPFSLIVKCKTRAELCEAINNLHGQLTATLIGNDHELEHYVDLIRLLKSKTGRIVFNGVPTGVEVCHSINHGGPFPAASSSHYTSVGADAIKRFVRPLCYQNWPMELLPTELRNENPKKILRRVNGKYQTDSIEI
jgi:2,5-dioxopentanoate dehydrogenase